MVGGDGVLDCGCTSHDVTISSSLGGGASIFAEYSSLTGAGAAAPGQTTAEGVVAVGTSVSF